jgi:hypothetical protein
MCQSPQLGYKILLHRDHVLFIFAFPVPSVIPGRQAQLRKTHEWFINKWNGITTWPSNSTPGHITPNFENKHSKICTQMFIAASFIISKGKKQLKCRTTVEQINTTCYSHAIKYYSVTKKNEVLIHATHEWTLKTWCYIKDARHKRPNIVLMHLDKMSRPGKCMETENRLGVSGV